MTFNVNSENLLLTFHFKSFQFSKYMPQISQVNIRFVQENMKQGTQNLVIVLIKSKIAAAK